MVEFVLIAATLLAGQAAPVSQLKPREAAKPKVAPKMDPDEALARYNEMREKTPPTAAAQWKLGIWCEEHGLKAEAYVHFAEVVKRDQPRDAASRKLGFKKVGGRWTTDEQLAEDNEQKKADKIWADRLKKIHKDIHGANGAKKQEQAQAAIDAITDPRAIPSIYRAFGVGGPSHQRIAVQVLGQINRRLSTQVLAMLAVYGKSADVRQRATATLRERPADDYLDLLVGLMTDPMKYEVKPVGGPGSPGVLFVEGQRFNVSRFYAPPMAPTVTPQPGDIITFDPSGMPLIRRPIAQTGLSGPRGVPGSKTLVESTAVVQYEDISPSQLMAEAQRGAAMAEIQLENDVKTIKSINDDQERFNNLVIAVAKAASGKSRGDTPKEWRDALAAGNNSSRRPSKTPEKPTYAELVPLAYNPVFAPVGFMSKTVTSVYVDT